MISGFSTLLRAFARDEDELRTLVPVEPGRLAEVPGLPRPRLSSGALARVSEALPLLAWGETAEVAAFRSRAGALPSAPLHPASAAALDEQVWHLPKPDPTAVTRVHHRAFALEVARGLGCALPGSRMVASLDELEAHLGAVEAEAWVVKAPLSAAGRSRYIHRAGEGKPAAKARRTLDGLFERHGSLLFEPWMDRVEDFGCSAILTEDATRVVGFHRLHVDRRGQFQGLELPAVFDGFDGLTRQEARTLEETVDAVSRALREAGYAGPFGIDAWRYRRDGRVLFHPLGEVNARMTFGLVARALIDRVAPALGLGRQDHVRLVLGKRHLASFAEPGVLPLLLPERHDPTAAWLRL